MNDDQYEQLTSRLLVHVAEGTTDQLDAPMRVSVDEYRDPERWQREVDGVFRRRPLLLTLSCELAEPGAFLTTTLLDVPVLAVRGGDGEVRAYLNVCAHRGATVVAEEAGTAKRFTCPYHAWSYDHDGVLVGVPGRESFGAVDPDLGLVPLPVAERAGMVFVVTTPGEPIAIDDWLAGVDEVLEPFAMHEWQLFSRRELQSPNWKLTYDGYLEGYHFQSLHRTTIFADVMTNTVAYDAYGPHQLMAFPRHGFAEICARPETAGDPMAALSIVITLFPNVAFALSRDGCLVSQLFPGPTVDRSRTVQSYYRRTPADTPEKVAAAAAHADRYHDVVRDEDYATAFGVQRGIDIGARDEFVFGRNEVGPQRFHRALDAALTPLF